MSRRSDHWDFIRGLSMAIMIVMHTSDLAGWKPFGVQLMRFYYPVIEPIIFLSGFLICLRALQSKPSPKLYALRRVIRTWPLYFLFVSVCFLLPTLPEFPIQKPLWSFLTFTMNWNLPPSGLGHLWTLCIEEWCYLIFLLCLPFLRRPGVNYVFLALALGPLLYRTWLVTRYGPFDYLGYFTRIHYGTLTHWDSFWWGCLLAPVYLARNQMTKVSRLVLIMGACLILFVYVQLAFRHEQTALLQVTNPLWGAAISALAVWGIHAVPTRLLKCTGLVTLGWMSYTFYLTHKVIMIGFFRFNRAHQWLGPQTWAEILACYAFLAVVGTALFFVFEYPILELLRRRFSSAKNQDSLRRST